jgi:hypothetical protein
MSCGGRWIERQKCAEMIYDDYETDLALPVTIMGGLLRIYELLINICH